MVLGFDLADKCVNSDVEPLEEPDRQFYFINKVRDIVKKQEEVLGRPLTCCVTNFGCQMNARDAERLSGILTNIGYNKIDNEGEADLVIFNTCTIREHANDRVYGRLGQLKPGKLKDPDKLIAISGCMTQDVNILEVLQKSYGFIDIILGTHNNHKLAELLHTRLMSGETVIDIWEEGDIIVENMPTERKYPYKAGVNITFGCDNFCSYCIVPYVRGRERSRDARDVLREIKDFANDGVVEVMLLGQNVNSYCEKELKSLERKENIANEKNKDSVDNKDNKDNKDKEDKEDKEVYNKYMSFPRLLEEIEKIPNIKRIRFMTSHPKDLSDELIEVMSKSNKICKHLHLPVQSGSTRILDLMNRHYTKEEYLLLVDKVRNAVSDISITTDIIVGFPGETEEDFEETMDLVRTVKFDSAFTFIFSPRKGTPAANMEDDNPKDLVKDRFNRLLKEVQDIGSKASGRHTGTVQEILVENINEKDKTLVTGRMSNNTLVHFPGKEELIGQFVNVKLTESKGFYYLGEIEK